MQQDLSPERLDEVMQFALLTSYVLLTSGAETYRAEESVQRICARFGIPDAQVIALTTGILVSLSRPGETPVTAMRSIDRRAIDLTVIDQTNDLCRAVAAGSVGLREAHERLLAISNPPKPKLLRTMLAAGLSSGCFALLFRGGAVDFALAALGGMLIQWMSFALRREESYSFIVSLLGGVLAALPAVLVHGFFGACSLDATIVGSIMPLLPGLAMTNAIRDTIRGDLISGVARAAEVLLIAVSLAAGVGTVLGVYWLIGGAPA